MLCSLCVGVAVCHSVEFSHVIPCLANDTSGFLGNAPIINDMVRLFGDLQPFGVFVAPSRQGIVNARIVQATRIMWNADRCSQFPSLLVQAGLKFIGSGVHFRGECLPLFECSGFHCFCFVGFVGILPGSPCELPHKGKREELGRNQFSKIGILHDGAKVIGH